MATGLKNLSDYDPDSVPDASGYKFAIVVSEWNHEITGSLLDGTISTLHKHGVSETSITVRWVPGSFELPFAAKLMADKGVFDAVICLGCVIQGETPHFTYVCEGVTRGITHLNLSYNIPFIFGVLTTDNFQQAKDRAGGKHGNKGDEAAIAAIKMISLGESL
ncbi:MAG: 6,7-dimethyl-8-ribityllumazine synthase [Bacteroidota bacterium]